MAQKSANKKVMRYATDANALFFKHSARYTEVSKVLIKVFSKTSQSNIDRLLKVEETKILTN